MAIHIQTNLSHLRKQRYLSQKAIGVATDIKLCTIRAYEQGVCLPRIPVVIKLANLFNVSLHEFCYVDLTNPTEVEAHKQTMQERKENFCLESS
jgi:transcriptional regulator with XRE-family HTH domain